MEQVSIETSGPVRTIRYGNPPRHYMTGHGSTLLLAQVQAALGDEAIRVIILTGTEDVFVRHFDVAEIVNAGEALAAGVISEKNFEGGAFVDLCMLLSAAPKPTIAAINGTCMGGGFEIAMACDIRVASRSVSEIGLPETRVGIFPGGGGTQRLPRLIGEAAALNFIMRGTVVDARTAAELGLVNEMADDCSARAHEIAADLAAKNPKSLAMIKDLVRGTTSRPIAEGLRAEQHGFAKILRDDDAMSAMRAFNESDDQDIAG